MINSSIEKLDEINRHLKEISHKVRPLQGGIQISVELYNLSDELNQIASELGDDRK